MYFVRTTTDNNQETISSLMTLIWRVVSNVNGIIFKDLKQTLRKEQCDVKIIFFF